MPKPTPDEITKIVKDNQRGIKYDTKDWSIEMVLSKFRHSVQVDDSPTGQKEINVPFYQREFVWKDEQISKLIETLLLGLPLPLIFLEETEDALLEIMDGSQRIRALDKFFGNDHKLSRLKILDKLNGLKFEDLPPAIQRQLNNSTLRIIVISQIGEKQENIAHEIFDRLNTGGTNATSMEIKKGSDYGEFIKLVYDTFSTSVIFNELSKFDKSSVIRGYQQEFIIKFLAFYNIYKNKKCIQLDNTISNVLVNFIKEENENCQDNKHINALQQRFDRTLDFIKQNKLIDNEKYLIRKKSKLLAIMLAVALYLDEPNAKQDNKVDIWQQEFETNANSPSIDSLNKNINFVLNKLNNG